MCGRTTRTNPDLFPEFSILGPAALPPGILTQSNSVTPGQDQLTVMMEDGTPTARLLKWGLVPSWLKDPKGKPAPFNARAETAASKPYFRDAFRNGRCLVLVDGFYEWQKVPSPIGKRVTKQPYFIHLPGREVFAFAGLMCRWKAAESEAAILTAAIVTRAAEGPASDVHTRMPLILPKDSEAVWMDSKQTDGQAALDAAQAVAVTAVVHHAVSSRVNSSRSAGAELIEPFPNPA